MTYNFDVFSPQFLLSDCISDCISLAPPSSTDTSIHVGYKENGSMSLRYNTDNNIMIDDHPSMTMDSEILPGLTCPTNCTHCTTTNSRSMFLHNRKNTNVLHVISVLHGKIA